MCRWSREGDQLQCKAANDSMQSNAMSGTMRALLQIWLHGVSQGFRAEADPGWRGLPRRMPRVMCWVLSLGFSHPVEHKMPEGVKVETPTQTEIVLKGADKQRVGQVAAEIRAYRSPEPYKGKGVRYCR